LHSIIEWLIRYGLIVDLRGDRRASGLNQQGLDPFLFDRRIALSF
jgi:hypothetical protein